MADKDTSKAKVINPLLCSSVTGLSLDDFIQNAVLVPAATAVQPNDNAQIRPPRTIPSGNTIIRNHPEIEPSIFTFQPNIPPAKNKADMTSKLDEIDLSKRDDEDDFDLDKYYSRLHTTPNLNKEEAEERIELKTSENEFSEIDLLSSSLVSEDRENSSMAADFAQNLSQLPSVLPHVANTVFNSFSSIWNAHKWESEDDRRFLKTGQDAQGSDAPFEEGEIKIGQDLSSGEGHSYQMPPMAPVPLFDTASFKGPGSRKSSIHGPKDEENRDVVDGKSAAVPKEVGFDHRSSPGPPPADISGANKYRLGSHKKKTYAHVPGLMLGETEYEPPRHHLPTSGIPPIPPINTPAQQLPSFLPINTNSPYNPNQNATMIPSIYQPPVAAFLPLPPTSNIPDQNITIVPGSLMSRTDVKPIPTFPSYGGMPNLASEESVQFFYTPTGGSGNISGINTVNDTVDVSKKDNSDDFLEVDEQKSQNLIKKESETNKVSPMISANLNEVNEDLNKVIGEEKKVKNIIENDHQVTPTFNTDSILHFNVEQNVPNPMFFDPNANNASMIPSSQLPPSGNLYSSQGKKSNLSVKNFYALLKKNSMLTGSSQEGGSNPAGSYNLPNVVPAPFGTPPVVIFNPGANPEFASSISVSQSQQNFGPPTQSNASGGNLTQTQQKNEVTNTSDTPPTAIFNPAANSEFASPISASQTQPHFEPLPQNVNVFGGNLSQIQQNNEVGLSSLPDYGQNSLNPSVAVDPPLFFNPSSTSEAISTLLPPLSAALSNTVSTSIEPAALNSSGPNEAPPMFFNPSTMSSSVLAQNISKPNVSLPPTQSELKPDNSMPSDQGSLSSSSILERSSPALVPPPAPPKSVPSGDDSGNKFRLTHKKRLTYYSGPIDYSQMEPHVATAPVATIPFHGMNESKPQQPPIFNPLSQASNDSQPNITIFNPGSNELKSNVAVFNPGFNEPQPNVSVFNPGFGEFKSNVAVFNPGFNEPEPNVSLSSPLSPESLSGAQNSSGGYTQASPYSSAYGGDYSSNVSLPLSNNYDQFSTQNRQYNSSPYQPAKDNMNSDAGKLTSSTSLLGLASKLQEKVSLNNIQKAVTSFFHANYYEPKKGENNHQLDNAEGIFIQSRETIGANAQPQFNSNFNNVQQPFYASMQFDSNNFINTTANYSNPTQNVAHGLEGNQSLATQFYNPNQYFDPSQSNPIGNEAGIGQERNKPNFESTTNMAPHFYDPNQFNTRPNNLIEKSTEEINMPKEQSLASDLTTQFYNPNNFFENQLKTIQNEAETSSVDTKQSISTEYYNPASFFDDQPSDTTNDETVQQNSECPQQANAVPDVLLNTSRADVNKSPFPLSSEKQSITSNKIEQPILPSAVGFFDTFPNGAAQDVKNPDKQNNVFYSIPFQSDFRKRPASPRVASFETDPLILDRHQDFSFEEAAENDSHNGMSSIGEALNHMNLSDNPSIIKEDIQETTDKIDVSITRAEVELKLQNKETDAKNDGIKKEFVFGLDENREPDDSADFDGVRYHGSYICENNTLNVEDREISNTTPEHSYHNQKTMNTAGFYDYSSSPAYPNTNRHSLPDNRLQRFDILDFGSENINSGDERDAFPPADRVYTSFDTNKVPARNSETIEFLNPTAMDGDRIDPSVEEHRLRLESQFGTPRSIDPREIYNAQLMRERRQLEQEWSDPQLGERRSSMNIRKEVEEVDARNEREDQFDIANEEQRLIEMLSRDTPLQNNSSLQTRAREEADQRNEELEQQLLQQLRLEASDGNTMDDDSYADENLEENNNDTDIDIVQEIQEDLMMTRMMQQEVMREAEQLDQLIGTFQDIIVKEAQRITPNRDATLQESTHPYTIEPNPFDSDEDSPVYENIPVKGSKPADKQDGSLGNYFLDSQFDDFSNFAKNSQLRSDQQMAAFVPIRSLSPRNLTNFDRNASFNNNPFGQAEMNEASLYDPISVNSNPHYSDSFVVPLAYIQQQIPFNHGSSDFVPGEVYAASITSSKEAHDGSDTSETYDYQRNISVSLQVVSGRRKSSSSDRDEGSFLRVMAEEQMELLPKDAQKNTDNENINISVFMQPPLAIPSFCGSSVEEQLSRVDSESIEEEQGVFEEREDFTVDCENNRSNDKDEFINDFSQSIESNYYGNFIDYPRDQTPELLEVEDISAVNPNNDDLSNVSLATSVAIEQRLERDFNDLCDREVQSIDFVPNSTGNAENADSFDDDCNLDAVENSDGGLTDYDPEAYAKLSDALQHTDLNDGTFGGIAENSETLGVAATSSGFLDYFNKDPKIFDFSIKNDSSEDAKDKAVAEISSSEAKVIKTEEITTKTTVGTSLVPEKCDIAATPEKEPEQNTVPLFNAFSFGLDNGQSFFNTVDSSHKASKPTQPTTRVQEEILGTSKKDDTRPVGVAQPYLYNSSNQTQGSTSSQSSVPNFVDASTVMSGASNPTYLIPVAVSSRPNYVDGQGNLYSNIQYQNQDGSEFFMLSQAPVITNPSQVITSQAQMVGNPPQMITNQNRMISTQQPLQSRSMMSSQQPMMSNQPPAMSNQQPMTSNHSQMSSTQRQMLPLRTQIPSQQPLMPNQPQIGLNHPQFASNQQHTVPLLRHVPNQRHMMSNLSNQRLSEPSLDLVFNQMSSIQQRELIQLHRDRNARIPPEFGALTVVTNQTVQVDEQTIRFNQNILNNYNTIPSRMPQNNNNSPSMRNANYRRLN